MAEKAGMACIEERTEQYITVRPVTAAVTAKEEEPPSCESAA